MNKYTLKLSADFLIIIHFTRKDACSLRFVPAMENVKAMNARGCRNENICILMFFFWPYVHAKAIRNGGFKNSLQSRDTFLNRISSL